MADSKGKRKVNRRRRMGVPELSALPTSRLLTVATKETDLVTVQGAVWVLATREPISGKAYGLLRERLLRTPPRQVTLLRTLIWALSLRREPPDLSLFAKIVRSHREPLVRRAALEAIGTHLTAEVRKLLVQTVERDRDDGVRTAALNLLPLHLDAAEAVRLVREALAHEYSPSVRSAWLRMLIVHRSPAGDELLAGRLRAHREPDAVKAHIATLLTLAGEDSRRILPRRLPASVRGQIDLVRRRTNEQTGWGEGWDCLGGEAGGEHA